MVSLHRPLNGYGLPGVLSKCNSHYIGYNPNRLKTTVPTLAELRSINKGMHPMYAPGSRVNSEGGVLLDIVAMKV